MIRDILSKCTKQFEWDPQLVGILPHDINHYVVCGMGGSHLGAWLLQSYTTIPITIHRDYGMPELKPNTLVVLSSYSGNTEEVLDVARHALQAHVPCAVITIGGALLTWARDNAIPYVLIPDIGLQPRLAVPQSMMALAHIMQRRDVIDEIRRAGLSIDVSSLQTEGESITQVLYERTPVFYASQRHAVLAYIWKIKLNETSKVPAFYNLVPEMCHNELESYDVKPATKKLSDSLCAVFIGETNDHPRVLARMKVVADILEQQGIMCEGLWLADASFHSILRSLLLADRVSISLAGMYGVPNEDTPLLHEFKDRMTQIA